MSSFLSEQDVLDLWDDLNAFQKTLNDSKDKPEFVFYDGPPFATGTPHYGHLVASTIKDIVGRYKTMTGFHVPRVWGWDCHGLPIEFKIEEKLGIKTTKQVLEFGIKNYNAECKKIVMKYRSEWKNTIRKIGRWVDMDNDYKTMDKKYMESVWWVFQQLYNKGLIYRGYKVVPYSMACATPLSNFEAKDNYKSVNDYSITVDFVCPERDATFLVWTTTPWTLPSNLMLAVKSDLDYCTVKVENTLHDESNESSVENTNQSAEPVKYIVAKCLLKSVFKKYKGRYTVLDTFKGSDLEGVSYTPPFDYYTSRADTGGFRVLCADWVDSTTGTGIVHCAPAFGANDYDACLEAGVISKTELPLCPLDNNGNYTQPVKEWEGVNVKVAEESIVLYLKQLGKLFKKEKIVHPYPFCWRSDTPLIYKVCECWYVEVSKLTDQLIKNNLQTNWVPQTIRDNRFGNWLEGACDWCISRNRFWGTPIPIWTNPDKSKFVCIGSTSELEVKAGLNPGSVRDLHRDSIDDITWINEDGELMTRVEYVLDCWFESGSMPYAINCYRNLDNKDNSSLQFADFIAEGLDQTRGWFYTLTVLGTALFDQSPFKNVIVNGIVLNEKGEKMSKRKNNYPPVDKVLNEFGADALRLYLISTPVVKAGDIKFKEPDIEMIVRKYHIMIKNTIKFYHEMVDLYKDKHLFVYTPTELKSIPIDNMTIMDNWILQCLNELVKSTHRLMDQYHLNGIVNKFLKFIDQLSRWYMNLNKSRFKNCEKMPLDIIWNCLLYFSVITAPFAPFMSESIYQSIRPDCSNNNTANCANSASCASVHFLQIPSTEVWQSDGELLELFDYFSELVDITRTARCSRKRADGTAANSIKLEIKEAVVYHSGNQVIEQLQRIESYARKELNIATIRYSNDLSGCVQYTIQPDIRAIKNRTSCDTTTAGGSGSGVVDGKDIGKIVSYFKGLSDENVRQIVQNKTRVYVTDSLFADYSELKVSVKPKKENVFCSNNLTIQYDMTITDEILEKYYSKLFFRGYQDARKVENFVQTDVVLGYYNCPKNIANVLDKYPTGIEGLAACNFDEFDALKEMMVHTIDLEIGLVQLKLQKQQ